MEIRLTTVYSKKIEEMLEAVMKWIPERNEEYLLIEGDFNKEQETEKVQLKKKRRKKKAKSEYP